jgi:hypothetical protein
MVASQGIAAQYPAGQNWLESKIMGAIFLHQVAIKSLNRAYRTSGSRRMDA